MNEAHDFFSYESPAEIFCDVKNYFRDGLCVNHDEIMGYRLSLQPLPNGADGGTVGSLRDRYADVACAPLGRGFFWDSVPRVSPWAITVGPVGASARRAQFAESVKLEQAIKANLRGLGYGE